MATRPGSSILMLAPCPFPTSQGSQTLIRQLATGLSRRGHRVHLVTYHHGEYEARFEFVVHRGRTVAGATRLRAGPSVSKLYLDLLLFRTALRVGREERPDIVHGHNYEGVLVGSLVASRLGVPLVYHTHNILQEELPTYFEWGLARWWARVTGAFVDRRLPHKADAVIALNEALRTRLVSLGVQPEKISVVPPGVWPEEWPTRPPTPHRASIVHGENLDNYQNLTILIDTMPLVVREVPDAVLTIVSHERNPSLEALARARGVGGAVDFVLVRGFEAVQRWIHEATVTVCPRLPSCGYPIKVVNYMAAGKPVVVSAACANGIVDGQTGLIVDPPTAEAFASAIVRVLRDPELARTLGDAAREFALSHLSWHRVLNDIEALYECLGAPAASVAPRGRHPTL